MEVGFFIKLLNFQKKMKDKRAEFLGRAPERPGLTFNQSGDINIIML
jgi:hypothetical protein